MNRKSIELTYIAVIALMCFRHHEIRYQSFAHTVDSLVHSVLRLQFKICVVQATNASESWQRGYESVRFLARYSFLQRRAGLDEARTKRRFRSIRYTLAGNFASGVGVCTEIVGLFKHLFRVTAHPQFRVLELRAPMSACFGHYGTRRWRPECPVPLRKCCSFAPPETAHYLC